jgi:DNA-binding GntR family transcriptional regulator
MASNLSHEMNGLAKRRGNSVDAVVETIREGILSGRFAPGQRLIVRDLMQEIAYSRSTLREAFRRLEADKLVSFIPNRGFCVQRLAPDEMQDLYRIREQLEGLAARLAAERIGEGRNRRRLLDVMKLVKSGDQLRETHVKRCQVFHAAVVELSGNARLAELLGQLQIPILMLEWRSTMSAKEIEVSRAEHIAIAKIILEGRAEQADAAMRRHLQRARERRQVDRTPHVDTCRLSSRERNRSRGSLRQRRHQRWGKG